MLKIGEVRELIRLLDETHLVELRIETDDMKLLLRKPSLVAGEVVAATPDASHTGMQTETSASVTTPAVVAPQTVASASTSADLQDPAMDDDHGVIITSPMVGTFYRAPAPGTPPFVEVGSRVTNKSVVCIVEAMKLMNEIEAEVQGEVVAILADNGQLVEYGQPLFKINPA